ncbi:hypothetical protein BDR05DRAFT_954652 [Suillus weaverae]|nr:hypothetical protein BDR05DRAFT_954652 [Suillus weaverae]
MSLLSSILPMSSLKKLVVEVSTIFALLSRMASETQVSAPDVRAYMVSYYKGHDISTSPSINQISITPIDIV